VLYGERRLPIAPGSSRVKDRSSLYSARFSKRFQNVAIVPGAIGSCARRRARKTFLPQNAL